MVPLVGRGHELTLLVDLLDPEDLGQARLVFVSGEAGVGKSRLVEEAVGRLGRPVLRGDALPESTSPYAPLVQALRAYCRTGRATLAGRPLAKHLALLLPELGVEPVETDATTLAAAICDAFGTAAESGTVLLLEDVHWADGATLRVITDLAKVVPETGAMVVVTYRNDELPRLHALRAVRAELRRARRAAEVVVGPLSRDGAGELAQHLAGKQLPDDVVDDLYERSGGIPFFIEELVAAAIGGPHAPPAPSGKRAVPETIRDALRQRTRSFDDHMRPVVEMMSAAGQRIDLPLLAEVTDPDAVSRVLEQGWLVEAGDGTASFRHALVRDAIYSDIPWLRRRAHHRALAEVLESRAGPPEEIAHHWLAAAEPLRARAHLVTAARSFCSLYAYADAKRVLEHALETWPEDADDRDRLVALELLATCVELCGDHEAALRLWRAVAKSWGARRDVEGTARAQRHVATLLEIEGDWSAAIEARLAAAEAFSASAQPADAAAERAAAASHLQGADEVKAALDLIRAATADAEAAGDPELVLRVRSLEGQIRAKLGEPAGVTIAEEALEGALAAGYTALSAEAYYRLASALEYVGRYEGALNALESASEFCKRQGVEDMGDVCIACTTPTLRHLGRWSQAVALCRSLMKEAASPFAVNVAAGELGLIHALRGNAASARPLLRQAARFAAAYEIFGLVIETSWGHASIAAQAGRDEEATRIATDLVEECLRREEWHYSLAALRWCATWFCTQREPRMLYSVVKALSNAAAATGSKEARTALAFAKAEAAVAQEDLDGALSHARQTIELLVDFPAPYETAEMRARCADILARAGQRDAALDALTASYRTARKLGARPLEQSVVERFRFLGEPIERHVRRDASRGHARGGLSRRETEVLRHVAAGRTNKQIAQVMFLSPRTVDMHVRNVLTKLDCRSRAEAVAKAAELDLLGPANADTA